MSFLAHRCNFSFPASRNFGQGGVCVCRAARAHPFGYKYFYGFTLLITPANKPFLLNEQITLDPQVRGTMIDTYFTDRGTVRHIRP